ncbi:ABC transporter ATP-binding protein [Celeribacter indicus]|uniref:Peptide ABC transporter ATPase n=1 Tax=Celeribacter indicus TaxID=1208324 RepID=A0A0B5E827_9RHOB|nr:ABC transporter ATP-binding protein [Celeribacter indicus]AJE48467.1 peptide ABC transporter ATPase [Celeribacter indicus]SDX28671.1 peptide/nickel transport system ATP-binding protein [Celeribacter indicus]
MTPILEMDRVSIRYSGDPAGAPAVRNVSLVVKPGETLGLVGESGSGKSTLAAAMMGLLPVNGRVEGRILFRGDDLSARSSEARRRLLGSRIAMIAQDPFTSLNPVVRIGRQLIEFQHWRSELDRKARWDRAVQMLRRVGLSDPDLRMKQFPHQLSGGIRQRIAIAAALLVGPDLLIADEPTTALDATTEDQIIELIRASREAMEGAVVFITHDMGVVRRLCDKVAVLYAGEMVEAGSVVEVMDTPQHPYTKALLACDPAEISEVTRNLPTIPGNVPPPDGRPEGCVFAPRCVEVLDECRTVMPEPRRLGEGRCAACLRVGAA